MVRPASSRARSPGEVIPPRAALLDELRRDASHPHLLVAIDRANVPRSCPGPAPAVAPPCGVRTTGTLRGRGPRAGRSARRLAAVELTGGPPLPYDPASERRCGPEGTM